MRMDEFTVDPEEFEEQEEIETTEKKYRSLGVLGIVGMVAFLGTLMLVNALPEVGELTAYTIYDEHDSTGRRARQVKTLHVTPPPLVLSRMRLVDTIYTTDSVYLDINLKKQHVTVHFRNGGERSFRISSGNPYISQGMSTPTGIFTVQNMMPMAISKQFNNARLHHWIGIQGGVGFHGLDGSGYYGYLGVRPSSHGCVRMSREEIADMYKLVHPGAPIMVHYGNPARVIAFCDPADTSGALVIDSAAVYNRHLGKERLRALYEGRYWTDPKPRIVHLARQRVRWGMEIGEASRVPRQELPRTSFIRRPERFVHASRPDRAGVELLRGDTYFSIQHSADSARRAERAEWREEERKVDYRE